MAEQSAEVSETKKSGRTVTGRVVSNRMDKSITVLIERRALSDGRRPRLDLRW